MCPHNVGVSLQSKYTFACFVDFLFLSSNAVIHHFQTASVQVFQDSTLNKNRPKNANN